MRSRIVWAVVGALVAAASLSAQSNNSFPLGPPKPEPIYILPDFVPVWETYSLQDIRMDAARSNDRLVSCEDWTQVDPNPITGQRVLSFTLGSPNYGLGHLRTRRTPIPEGWQYYQTYSILNEDGTCSSYEQEIAIVPPGQTGRWLPLGKFALYMVDEKGGVGQQVACQIKRWCCLISIPTCSIPAPCSLPCAGDCINAGTRDVYPFHFLDQFIPIEGIPTGYYYVEHEINPARVMVESDYENNRLLFQIYLDQEKGSVTITMPPEGAAQCPVFQSLFK